LAQDSGRLKAAHQSLHERSAAYPLDAAALGNDERSTRARHPFPAPLRGTSRLERFDKDFVVASHGGPPE
jgi:hypothetical protein